MTPDQLKARTKKFAVNVIRFAKTIPKDHINDDRVAIDGCGNFNRGSLSSRLPGEVTSRFHQQVERGGRRSRRVRAVARDSDGSGYLAKGSDATAVDGSRRADSNSGPLARNGTREAGPDSRREINNQKSTTNHQSQIKDHK
jgi:hypothetical protein